MLHFEEGTRLPPALALGDRSRVHFMARTMRVLGVAPDDPALVKRRVDFGPPPSQPTRWAYAPNVAPASNVPAGVVR